jgi:hypothetical protein
MNGPVMFFLYAYVAVMLLLAAMKLLQGKSESALSLALMGIVVALLAGGVKYIYDSMTHREALASQAPAAAVEPPKPVTPPDRPIEMRPAEGESGDKLLYAVGFLLAGLGMLVFPDMLWSRWLAYPAALVLLVLSGFSFHMTYGLKNQTLVADGKGIEIREKGEVIDKIAWSDVGTVKIQVIEHRKSTRSVAVEKDRNFLLLDRSGELVLTIAEPLTPPESYRLFLNCIPSWTGLTVEHEVKAGSKTYPRKD